MKLAYVNISLDIRALPSLSPRPWSQVAQSRQEAARAALRDFRAAGLRLSRLCKIIEKYLSKVSRANMARDDGIKKEVLEALHIQMVCRRCEMCLSVVSGSRGMLATS